MNKYDSLLLLKSPKILSNIITYSPDNKYNINMTSLIQEEISYVISNEQENNYKNVNFTESKKIKSKNKKKNKDSIYLEKNVSQAREDMELDEIKASTLIRSSKNLKAKKTSSNQESLNKQETSSKEVYLNNLLTVDELAIKLNISNTDIIKWLFLQGISVTINQLLDISVSTLVAKHYSFNILQKTALKNNLSKLSTAKEEGRLRAPVVTLLGHVDHGKTSLLKAIRNDYMSIKEAGNITQGIGSYEIFLDNDKSINKIIFLDTPGHEAFIDMRERVADITDIVILVVAADDGLKPQTIEAINYIHEKNLPFIVAINKIDKIEVNINQLEKQLIEFDVSTTSSEKNRKIVKVSALNGQNINQLVDSLIEIASFSQWKSDPSKHAQGTIIEAYLNRQKGPVAQLLIQDGTLFKGDIVVSGKYYGKVKSIQNSLKQTVNSLESTSLADVLCFTEVPVVGVSFIVVNTEKKAKAIVSKYFHDNISASILNNRISLDEVQKKFTKAIVKQVNLIIKTNTKGSIDAIIKSLSSLPQEKVQINLLMVACGDVSLKDIDLSIASNAILLAFSLNIPNNIIQHAERRGLSLKSFHIIYDLIDSVKEQMLTFIDVEYKKNILGAAEVKDIFTVNKRVVAGCIVKEGKLKKNAYFQIQREDEIVYTGSIDSLKRVKEDVDEVNENNECGILCKDYNLWKIEDFLQCYELQALDKTL